MYIPKDKALPLGHDEHVRKREREGSSKRKAIYPWLLPLLLLAMLCIAASVQSINGSSQEQTQDMAIHDLGQLWDWSDELFLGGAGAAEWTLRWDVTIAAEEAERLADTIFRHEDGTPLDKTVTEDGEVISARMPAGGEAIGWYKVERQGDYDRYMLLLEAKGEQPMTLQRLLEAANRLSTLVEAHSAPYAVSMKASGYTKHGNAADTLQRLALAEEREKYKDTGTISRTLYSGQLRSGIAVAQGRTANLQLALHEDTESDARKLTIGVPLISGEF
ncbi:YwmB family TATA-box binding protein [Paenibacillus sp. J5C_2022]|uniref:YwmB family TATA-box binding protein n=1 Tax=Paenibacillus sp. J5C2022 TaxID=2977129 RepID=UPI0021D26CE3|nr:YwmB family TATA-box binding protein [Paenibacillus sp. J5C2022]MCU6711997.1 YwmB family TATA-box binding protein [Paenibacillus sp. J5C2022]